MAENNMAETVERILDELTGLGLKPTSTSRI
jgi:hypothetical protein